MAWVRAAEEHLRKLGVPTEKGPDGALRIDGQLYAVQVAPSAEAALRLAVRLAAEADASPPRLIVAPHVPAATGARLSALGAAYVDAAGNARLRQPGLLVEVSGRPAPADVPAKARTPRLFRGAGLQALFALLVDPTLVAAPVRALADAAGISVGAAHGVRIGLDEAGHVVGAGSVRALVDVPALARRWVDQYALDLFPRGVVADLDGAAGWWRHVDPDELAEADGLWGGETAAEILGGHLVTPRGVLYAPTLPTRIATRYRLRRTGSAAGTAQVRRRFWGSALDGTGTTTPSLLVYADLLADGSPRLVEAAQLLKEGDDALRRLLDG